MLPDGFITECRREFDRDPGSTAVLIALLEKAFSAGRESAYDRDETEWSCRMTDGRSAFACTFTEGGARRYAADHPEHLAVFNRRVGPWVRVPEVGGTDADA